MCHLHFELRVVTITSPFRHPVVPILASVGAGLAAIAGAVGVYSYLIEPSWLDVTHPSIVIPDLNDELDGFRIAQLSDFHLAPNARGADVILRAIDACDEAKPDVVVLTGDYLASRRALPILRDVLKRLTARPALVVFGNHDYRFGRRHRQMMVSAFQDAGITLLDNASSAVSRGSSRVWFVGVGDAHTSHDRLDEAMRGLTDLDRPRILLSHYPDFLLELPPLGFDLALAGHTHGLQVRVPLLTRWALRDSCTTYSSGFFTAGGVPLYINRGLGCSNHHIRFRSRPELTFITLRAPAPSG